MAQLMEDIKRIKKKRALESFNERKGYNADDYAKIKYGFFGGTGWIIIDKTKEVLITENISLYDFDEEETVEMKRLSEWDFDGFKNIEYIERFDTEVSTSYSGTTKNSPSITKALVGGALFGPAGAIIGGSAGKSTTNMHSTSTNIVNCYRLGIIFEYGEFKYRLDFITKKTPVPQFDAEENFLEEFQTVVDMFEYIKEFNAKQNKKDID